MPRRRAIVSGPDGGADHPGLPTTRRNSARPVARFPPASDLTLTAPDGEIYYTLDGSDPSRRGRWLRLAKPSSPDSAEKWALVPSSDNGGDTLGNRWPWRRGAVDHDDWDSGNDGVGYDQNADYDPHIGIDVDAEMNGINQSVIVRIPFKVLSSDRKKSNFMVLQMKYDDGFVAYLNGTRIASANAAANPGWNAGATGQHDDASAVTWVSFDAGKYINKLKAGNIFSPSMASTPVLAVPTCSSTPSCRLASAAVPRLPTACSSTRCRIKLTGDTTIRTRTMHNGQWSALVEHSFQAERAGTPLRFTEIMYNPAWRQ